MPTIPCEYCCGCCPVVGIPDTLYGQFFSAPGNGCGSQCCPYYDNASYYNRVGNIFTIDPYLIFNRITSTNIWEALWGGFVLSNGISTIVANQHGDGPTTTATITCTPGGSGIPSWTLNLSLSFGIFFYNCQSPTPPFVVDPFTNMCVHCPGDSFQNDSCNPFYLCFQVPFQGPNYPPHPTSCGCNAGCINPQINFVVTP